LGAQRRRISGSLEIRVGEEDQEGEESAQPLMETSRTRTRRITIKIKIMRRNTGPPIQGNIEDEEEEDYDYD